MALSKANALDAAKAILNGPRALEMTRLDRIHRALKPRIEPGQYVPSVEIPTDAPTLMKEQARKAETNYLLRAVKEYRQVIKVEGYFSATDDGKSDPWVHWQRNGMDARQAGLVDGALKYGVSYATALPGSYSRGVEGPVIKRFSPREMTAVYQDLETDEWPMLALALTQDGRGRTYMTLFDEEQTYKLGVEDGPWPGGFFPAASVALESGRLVYVEDGAHETGVCPIVRFCDRNLLAGEEQYGIVEPLLTIQERLDETTFQMLVAQYFQAFKQRYVIGWVPKDESEALKAGAARQWYLDMDPSDVRIDQLDAGAITPYIESRNAALRDLAATGQLPVQSFGIDGISNISDATLAGLEAAKNREAGEISTSLGESYEQLLRLCAYIDGNTAAADDYASEIRWADMEARSFAATIDALGKLVTMLGLDPALALEDVPGMTPQKLERAQTAMARDRVRQTLAQRRGVTGGDAGPTA